MLKSRGSRVGKSDPLDNIIRSMIKHVILTRKTIDIPELADLFVYYIYKDFGCPKGIILDRGSVFTSKF